MQTDKEHDNVVLVDFAARKQKQADTPNVEITKSSIEKQHVFEEFLKAGIVAVAFDPSSPIADIPRRFRGLNSLIFNYSYGYRIEDFRFDNEGIRATLMFPEGYYYCFVPWNAVFSMRSEALQMESTWADDMPLELQDDLDIPKSSPSDTPKKGSHLTLVKDSE